MSATTRRSEFYYLFRLEVAELVGFALHFPLERFCPRCLLLCPVSLVTIDTPPRGTNTPQNIMYNSSSYSAFGKEILLRYVRDCGRRAQRRPSKVDQPNTTRCGNRVRTYM